MTPEEKRLFHFSKLEFKTVHQSFGHLYFTYRMPDFETRIEYTKEITEAYLKSINPAELLIRDLSTQPEKALNKRYKMLEGGFRAYWHKKSQSVIFETPDKEWIVYQPEEGKNYYTNLTKMEFTLTRKGKLSILMWLSLFDLEIMLAAAKATYRKIHEEWEEYNTLLGIYPEEGREVMKMLQTEIDRLSAQ